MEENLQREKKVRADVEKAKRKVESDLKMTQEAVEELEKVKGDLEANVRKSVSLYEPLCCSLILVHHANIFFYFYSIKMVSGIARILFWEEVKPMG